MGQKLCFEENIYNYSNLNCSASRVVMFYNFNIINSVFCRFCLSETSCPQEDNYPNGLCIKVNGKIFPLPVRVCLCPKTCFL